MEESITVFPNEMILDIGALFTPDKIFLIRMYFLFSNKLTWLISIYINISLIFAINSLYFVSASRKWQYVIYCHYV